MVISLASSPLTGAVIEVQNYPFPLCMKRNEAEIVLAGAVSRPMPVQ